ncbi:MAG: hypothetical protein ACRERC_02170 [Candidatus Binatia bacterium]
MHALRLLLVLALLVGAAGCSDDGSGSWSSRFRNLGKRAASADVNPPARAPGAPDR